MLADEKSSTQTLYDILEVSHDAAQEEIYEAFLKAKHTYSPESPALYSVFSTQEADELLRMIEDAYSVLGNPIKRKKYDDSLGTNYIKKIEKSAPQKIQSPQRLEIVADGNLGKTIYSHYGINPEFEAEISNQKIFDGSFIQKIRIYKNVSLDQISKSTRIGRQYLVAVEANDFHSLPAPVFVRGFISQLARILNLNEQLVTDSFMKLLKQSLEK